MQQTRPGARRDAETQFLDLVGKRGVPPLAVARGAWNLLSRLRSPRGGERKECRAIVRMGKEFLAIVQCLRKVPLILSRLSRPENFKTPMTLAFLLFPFTPLKQSSLSPCRGKNTPLAPRFLKNVSLP